ncbi:MAG TPA: cyclic nucleotide-binding domain-containing protein [Negativicutes bacterium]
MINQTELLEKNIKIGIASTPEEKMEIYRFRYHIYAEEIGFKLVSVDHNRKLLYDELDEWGLLLYAKLGNKIVGTGRVNIGQFAAFPPEVAKAFRMEKFKDFYKETDNYNFAYASKGMIAPAYRSSPVHNLLMATVNQLYYDNQVQFAFINCNFHLIPLHEHYGSRRLRKNILDPNLGPMASFVLLVNDVQYLGKIRSPFFSLTHNRKTLNSQKSVEWFYKEFAEILNSTVNSQLVTPDKLWAILCGHLGDKPNKLIAILHGLSAAEAKQFLHYCGIIVQCDAGDYITSHNDVSQELNILLSGKVQPVSTLPGQHLGQIGLVNRTRHTENIIAATAAEILVLSFHYFRKFRLISPSIATKILKNYQRLSMPYETTLQVTGDFNFLEVEG